MSSNLRWCNTAASIPHSHVCFFCFSSAFVSPASCVAAELNACVKHLRKLRIFTRYTCSHMFPPLRKRTKSKMSPYLALQPSASSPRCAAAPSDEPPAAASPPSLHRTLCLETRRSGHRIVNRALCKINETDEGGNESFLFG